MSASDTPSQFSANSRDLKRFRLMQKLKSASFVVVIGVPLLIGIAAYGLYEGLVNPKPQEEVAVVADFPDTTDPAVDAPITTDPNSPVSNGNVSSTPQAPSAPAGSGSSAAPQTGSMPEGVTVAINSIEQNGIKNNNYVNMDTSSVPDGTVVRANRSSWTAYGNDLGSVAGTISAYGQTKNGSLTFQLVSGTWKVTGYSIDA